MAAHVRRNGHYAAQHGGPGGRESMNGTSSLNETNYGITNFGHRMHKRNGSLALHDKDDEDTETVSVVTHTIHELVSSTLTLPVTSTIVPAPSFTMELEGTETTTVFVGLETLHDVITSSVTTTVPVTTTHTPLVITMDVTNTEVTFMPTPVTEVSSIEYTHWKTTTLDPISTVYESRPPVVIDHTVTSLIITDPFARVTATSTEWVIESATVEAGNEKRDVVSHPVTYSITVTEVDEHSTTVIRVVSGVTQIFATVPTLSFTADPFLDINTLWETDERNLQPRETSMIHVKDGDDPTTLSTMIKRTPAPMAAPSTLEQHRKALTFMKKRFLVPGNITAAVTPAVQRNVSYVQEVRTLTKDKRGQFMSNPVWVNSSETWKKKPTESSVAYKALEPRFRNATAPVALDSTSTSTKDKRGQFMSNPSWVNSSETWKKKPTESAVAYKALEPRFRNATASTLTKDKRGECMSNPVWVNSSETWKKKPTESAVPYKALEPRFRNATTTGALSSALVLARETRDHAKYMADKLTKEAEKPAIIHTTKQMAHNFPKPSDLPDGLRWRGGGDEPRDMNKYMKEQEEMRKEIGDNSLSESPESDIEAVVYYTTNQMPYNYPKPSNYTTTNGLDDGPAWQGPASTGLAGGLRQRRDEGAPRDFNKYLEELEEAEKKMKEAGEKDSDDSDADVEFVYTTKNMPYNYPKPSNIETIIIIDEWEDTMLLPRSLPHKATATITHIDSPTATPTVDSSDSDSDSESDKETSVDPIQWMQTHTFSREAMTVTVYASTAARDTILISSTSTMPTPEPGSESDSGDEDESKSSASASPSPTSTSKSSLQARSASGKDSDSEKEDSDNEQASEEEDEPTTTVWVGKIMKHPHTVHEEWYDPLLGLYSIMNGNHDRTLSLPPGYATVTKRGDDAQAGAEATATTKTTSAAEEEGIVTVTAPARVTVTVSDPASLPDSVKAYTVTMSKGMDYGLKVAAITVFALLGIAAAYMTYCCVYKWRTEGRARRNRRRAADV
ncbi:hypothetical protein K490DRAFT_55225 [Saccharata proteae CBS 121410]|uniref:Uncharacterized protein n=1 Tax=Saccharata proteae CBS 121410 TaxID=1314787 RepID=A0A6A5YFF0_9PEZI|nr:hypothetical protein K490DRAFT_55225 [Saccharata proteae CBS 121410]